MLDDIKIFEKYDEDEASFGIERLPEQVHAAWNATREITVPASYKKTGEILVVGMGGSGLCGEVIQSALRSEMKKPVTAVHDYELPKFVSSKTLVVIVSFSGETEEVLSVAKEAKRLRSKVLVVTSGGALGKMAKREKWPMYQFTPGELAKRPNLGLGFLFFGCLGLLERCGHMKLSKARMDGVLAAMTDVLESCDINVLEERNPAKTVAKELHGKSLLFVTSGHLTGNGLVLMHQVNELAKQYARAVQLPEMNHHFLESVTRPTGFFAKFSVLMIRSALYHPRTRYRYELTAKALEKIGATVIDYQARGKDALEEMAELLQFGSFLAYYLGILNKVEISQSPYTDHFKKEMAKKK